MAQLQDTLERELGRRTILNREIPGYIETSLSPTRKMRPYQEECLKYFLLWREIIIFAALFRGFDPKEGVDQALAG